MSWKHYDPKTKICEYRSLPRVLCDFDTVVMDENTWNAIKKASLPTFLDNLKKLLDSYSDEEFMLTIRYFYILHIEGYNFEAHLCKVRTGVFDY